jgi:hypothetical protein
LIQINKSGNAVHIQHGARSDAQFGRRKLQDYQLKPQFTGLLGEDFENDHHLATNLSSPQKILMYAMYLE